MRPRKLGQQELSACIRMKKSKHASMFVTHTFPTLLIHNKGNRKKGLSMQINNRIHTHTHSFIYKYTGNTPTIWLHAILTHMKLFNLSNFCMTSNTNPIRQITQVPACDDKEST